ncbi:MAG: hypothetical protein K0Q47_100 [Sedimentibacter sp.]|jgi:hypothetical protein|nr:hypothetical protein [Sedimentibacter sp.]
MTNWDKKIRKTNRRKEAKNKRALFNKKFDEKFYKIYSKLLKIYFIIVFLIILYIVFISLAGEAKLGF